MVINDFRGAIFDLDGVIVDTAKYHYLAWKRLAAELGFVFSERDNEKLKGVNRIDSLSILLEVGNLKVSERKMKELADKKNNWYLGYIDLLEETNLLPGAKEYIQKLIDENKKIAIASASKNTEKILFKLKIRSLFDVVIDGNSVKKTKPDPEAFLLAAHGMELSPEECIVYEDSQAGIDGARKANMRVVGIGNKEYLKEANMVVKGLIDLID